MSCLILGEVYHSANDYLSPVEYEAAQKAA